MRSKTHAGMRAHARTHACKVDILAHCPQTLHWLLQADKESVVFFFQDISKTHTSMTSPHHDHHTHNYTTPSLKTMQEGLRPHAHTGTHTNLPINPQSVMLYQPDSTTVWCWGCYFSTKNLQFLSPCITLTICSVAFLSIHVPLFNTLRVRGLSTSVEAKSAPRLSGTAYWFHLIQCPSPSISISVGLSGITRDRWQ